MPDGTHGGRLRRAIAWVIGLNASFFVVELAVALAIASVALFADSADFAEDAILNLLVLAGLGWSAARRARLGMALSGVLLLPLLGFAYGLYQKFITPEPPAPLPLTVTGAAALAINLACALLLVRHRHSSGSLTRVAFLSARNDVAANAAIIAAGFVTAAYPSVWPDVVVGVGIAAMNIGAAREVWRAARAEHAMPEDPVRP